MIKTYFENNYYNSVKITSLKDLLRMTVETASISSALVPPKKRDFSEYPIGVTSSPEMEEDHRLHHMHHNAPSSPPPTPDQSSPASSNASKSYKSEPLLKSSGFMITDILSPPQSSMGIPPGLRIEQFAPAHHLAARVPSPHGDRDSSDAGSYKENDLSDDGEGNFYLNY